MENTYPILTKRYILQTSESETPEVQLVRLTPQDGIPLNFDAGMFVMLHGMDKTTGQRCVGRALSIASEPNSSFLEFFVVKEHDGHVSYFTLAKPGDSFDVIGPHGQFKLVPGSSDKVLFIAGGTGLAPFMSMLRHLRKINAKDDVILIYSVKYPTEIIRRAELGELSNSINMKMCITVTRPQPEDGWSGQTGHIDNNVILKYAPDVLERTSYICGPLGFVKAIKDALNALKVPPEEVKADVWG